MCWQNVIGLHLIRHWLKEDWCCRDFLLLSHETVCEVTSVRKVQPHDPAVGLHNGCVDGKVSRRTLGRRSQREDWGRSWRTEHVISKLRRPEEQKTLKTEEHSQALHKTLTQSFDSIWYQSRAARWCPICLSPDRRLPAPSSDTVSPAHQHALYHHSTWIHRSW